LAALEEAVALEQAQLLQLQHEQEKVDNKALLLEQLLFQQQHEAAQAADMAAINNILGLANGMSILGGQQPSMYGPASSRRGNSRQAPYGGKAVAKFGNAINGTYPQVMLKNPTGVGDHSNYVQSIREQAKIIAEAKGLLEVLDKDFYDKE
jgi:hypothetical protein